MEKGDLNTDFHQILDFLRVARRMQLTLRATPKPENNFENDAEHSWALALEFMLLASRLEDELGIKIDQLKGIKMAIIHDLAEVKTGDTKTWDIQARIGKEERERAAIYEMTDYFQKI